MIRAMVVSMLVLLLPTGPAFADRAVVLVEDGITVEEESRPGSDLPRLTGTTQMTATPARIAAWLNAPHTFTEWQHNCEEARFVIGPNGDQFTYNRIASPWPVSDRDVVLKSERTDGDDGSIRIVFRSTDDVKVPVPRGAIRMVSLVGSYTLKPVDGGTHVEYKVDSDPGGSLPSWLVRQAAKDLPYFTLKNLRARAEVGLPPEA